MTWAERIIDLSMPIETGHFRWPVERTRKGSFAKGDLFEIGSLKTSCHAFTHIDAPSHMVPGGATLDDLDLRSVVGPAAVIDLSDVEPRQEITAARLAAAAGHLQTGEIALLKTEWDARCDVREPAFWRDAPFLARDACEWLLARKPSAVALDFPQDYTIRLLLDGIVRPIEEHVSHDVLLRNGVTLIEYLASTRKLTASRTWLCALPLRLDAADGAPARVIAIERNPPV